VSPEKNFSENDARARFTTALQVLDDIRRQVQPGALAMFGGTPALC